MKIQEILQRYPENILMRLAIRTFRNRVIGESKAPQSGAYWWIPHPDGSWDLEIFYDSEYGGETDHIRMWRKYVIEKLAVIWKKDPQKLRAQIGDNYTGLPRGRVNKVQNGYTIVHGNDTPTKNGLDGIINAFNLRAYQLAHSKNILILFDEHETMIQGDPERVQKALGVKLGLHGLSVDLDYD